MDLRPLLSFAISCTQATPHPVVQPCRMPRFLMYRAAIAPSPAEQKQSSPSRSLNSCCAAMSYIRGSRPGRSRMTRDAPAASSVRPCRILRNAPPCEDPCHRAYLRTILTSRRSGIAPTCMLPSMPSTSRYNALQRSALSRWSMSSSTAIHPARLPRICAPASAHAPPPRTSVPRQ